MIAAWISDDMLRIVDCDGRPLGAANVVASWVGNGGRVYQVEAWIDGRLYTGRSMGGLWRGKLKALTAFGRDSGFTEAQLIAGLTVRAT